MWFLAAGVENINVSRRPNFTQEGMAVQAALDGQGVVLIGDKLVEDHLTAGALVRPLPHPARRC